MNAKETRVCAEMARRKVRFHPEEKAENITLWGLFSWGEVFTMLKQGKLRTNMVKENKTIWVRPNMEYYKEHIQPLECLSEERLMNMAGWK